MRDNVDNFTQCTVENFTPNAQLMNKLLIQVGGQISSVDTKTFAGQAAQFTFYPNYYPDEYPMPFLEVLWHIAQGWAGKTPQSLRAK